MIRVLIVDDSAVVRKVLTMELSKHRDIEVVGGAIDPYVARDKIVRLRPDVVTLDLEMPRMNGLAFLAKLMKHYPLPVVVVSSLTPKNSETAMRALELGAVEVICKPGSAYSASEISHQLIQAVRAAASARIAKSQGSLETSEKISNGSDYHLPTTDKVLAIGASTGGTQAIESVLRGLPRNSPGTLIVQHMPEQFTTTFAKRLNQICQMEVREAQDNDPVLPGVALVAQGNHHLLLQQNGARYLARVKDGPAVNHQRPSADVLFQSVARFAGSNAIGVLLTGMGSDGAKGLLAMHEKGAYTLAQDEETCVVFGMPKEAIKLGAVDDVAPIQQIPHAIIRFLQKQGKRDEDQVL
ncbi:MAG: chemotaxis response regulator protein-glutamate methylesterase [Thermodesulfobacteriota bacterium]